MTQTFDLVLKNGTVVNQDGTGIRDVGVIDGVIVNGSAKFVGWISSVTRLFQTGYVYHYAFTMIIGLFVLMTLWINRA